MLLHMLKVQKTLRLHMFIMISLRKIKNIWIKTKQYKSMNLLGAKINITCFRNCIYCNDLGRSIGLVLHWNCSCLLSNWIYFCLYFRLKWAQVCWKLRKWCRRLIRCSFNNWISACRFNCDGRKSDYDTIMNFFSQQVSGIPPPTTIWFIVLGLHCLGFFIQSSSGLAVLSMPIMAPLANVVGIDRASIIDAYNWGQGFISLVAPTGLILMSLMMEYRL